MSVIAMLRMLSSARIFGACVLAAFCANATHAESREGHPWQEWVLRADFVGVVECTDLQGSIAEFKVQDAWTPGKTGDTLRAYSELLNPEDSISTPKPDQRYALIAFRLTDVGRARIRNHPRAPDWETLESIDYFVSRDYRLKEVVGEPERRTPSGREAYREYDNWAKRARPLMRSTRSEREFTLVDAPASETSGYILHPLLARTGNGPRPFKHHSA